jgi:hypothetical protein
MTRTNILAVVPPLVALAFGLALLSAPAFAAAIPAYVKADRPYDPMRAKLKKGRWKAIGKSRREEGACPDYDSRCVAYPEARECSGTGLGYCNMVWRHKDGTVLVITTAGEEKLTVTGRKLSR